MQNPLIIFDFNRTLYNPDVESLFEGVRDLLEELVGAGYRLILLGKGDEARKKKLKVLDIEKYFSEIYMIPEKDLQQLQDIREKASEEVIYSVGDRVKKEIRLGNQMGFQTVWFRNGKFADQVPESENEVPSKVVGSFAEIRRIFILES